MSSGQEVRQQTLTLLFRRFDSCLDNHVLVHKYLLSFDIWRLGIDENVPSKFLSIFSCSARIFNETVCTIFLFGGVSFG